MISPSEDKGLALGLRLLKFEPHKRTESVDGKTIRTKVYARFESPPIPFGRVYPGTGAAKASRRHVLHSYAKSRAGAWKHAIRWLRQLQKGKLT